MSCLFHKAPVYLKCHNSVQEITLIFFISCYFFTLTWFSCCVELLRPRCALPAPPSLVNSATPYGPNSHTFPRTVLLRLLAGVRSSLVFRCSLLPAAPPPWPVLLALVPHLGRNNFCSLLVPTSCTSTVCINPPLPLPPVLPRGLPALLSPVLPLVAPPSPLPRLLREPLFLFSGFRKWLM